VNLRYAHPLVAYREKKQQNLDHGRHGEANASRVSVLQKKINKASRHSTASSGPAPGSTRCRSCGVVVTIPVAV